MQLSRQLSKLYRLFLYVKSLPCLPFRDLYIYQNNLLCTKVLILLFDCKFVKDRYMLLQF